ncbi:MAG TPA: hypothetical protein VLO12_00670 [Halomonas sp.]|nr:hypothetical protein [Halomonas sp.]
MQRMARYTDGTLPLVRDSHAFPPVGDNGLRMKQQTFAKPMDERDKLRRFRELDDAFADALRELDDPNSRMDIPTGPPVRSLEAQDQDLAQEQREEVDTRQLAFERQLNDLMKEYAQSAENVSDLLRTLYCLDEQ